VATASDTAEFVAEIVNMLRNSEGSAPEESREAPSVENLLAHVPAYMEVRLAA